MTEPLRKEILNLKEACVVLGISRTTALRLILAGQFPWPGAPNVMLRRDGKEYRISRRLLEAACAGADQDGAA